MYRDQTTNQIVETFEDEILNLFEKADFENDNLPVDVIYAVDSKTGKDLEIWRSDYI